MVVLRRHPQIVVRYDVDLSQGSCGSSVQVDMSLPQIRVEYGRKHKANFVHNNAEGSRKHRKDRSNCHCRNRAPF